MGKSTEPTQKQKKNSVYQKLVDVMKSIGYVGKNQTNKFDEYDYRGIDDVFNALNPALIKSNVIMIARCVSFDTQRIEKTGGKISFLTTCRMVYEFVDAKTCDSVSIESFGEGMDRGDKSLNKAISSALKNMVFQTFCVPTRGGMIDSETESIKAEMDPGIMTAVSVFLMDVDSLQDLNRFWDENKKEFGKLQKKQYQDVVKQFTETKMKLTKANSK